jgi:hypothetical protein
MRDPDRTTEPPPPPPMRPKQQTLRDGAPPPAISERELILQAIQSATESTKRELSELLEERLQQSRSTPPPKKQSWQDIATKLVAALGVIAGALGMLKPSKDERVDKAYEDLAKAVRTIETQQQRSDSSVEALRAWLAGYFNATGVKVIDLPGAPAPARVELLPPPLQPQDDDVVRPGARAPAIQVRTPLPSPPPSAAPIKLAPRLPE